MRAPRPILATVAAVLAAGALTACNTPEAAAACPTGAPGTATAPDWTHPGQTGSIVVTGSTDTPGIPAVICAISAALQAAFTTT